MSLEQPSMTTGYLHQVLVNGVTPFRYRSNVRSLLGMPDRDANPTSAANSLPPIEFLYARCQSMVETDLSEFISQGDLEVDNEARADWENSPISEPVQRSDRTLPLLNEPRTQTNLPTPSTLQAQQFASQKPEPVQEQPISSAIERTFPSTMEAIAPSPTTDVLAKETPSTTHLDNLPRAITIPGVTNYHSLKVDHSQIIPQSSQQNELGKAVDFGTQSDSEIDNQLIGITAIPLPISDRHSETNELGKAVDFGTQSDSEIDNQLIGITAIPLPISDRNSETGDVSTRAPSSVNLLSLKQSSSLQSLSNLGIITSTQQPQSIPSEPEVDSPAVQPIAMSFRPKVRTDANTILTEKLTAQSIPTPMPQGNSQARLPIAAAPIPMASVSNMPHNPANAAQPAAKVTEELTRLRRMVTDLTAQVTAQQEFQRPAPPIVLPPPVASIKRPPAPAKSPQAFWERSYLNRWYRWSHR
jgi:hypothetical protein